MKYKVGDRVRLASAWFGQTMTVKYAYETVNTYRMVEDGGRGLWTDEMISGLATDQSKIVITVSGNTVNAQLYNGKEKIKSAKAKCSPDDTFDFQIGAKLALDRLFGTDEKKNKPEPAKETIKMYCVKSYRPGEFLTAGKTYDWSGSLYSGSITFDYGWRSNACGYSQIYLWDVFLKDLLVPLVKRPVKVGEWVYITEDRMGEVKPGTIWEVAATNQCGNTTICTLFNPLISKFCYWARDGYCLVLDGYHGDR